MSSFTNALIAKKLRKQEWEVVQDFSYEVGSLGSGEKIKVPSGFITDLTSVPRVFWVLFPTDSDYTQAAVLHDWLCVKKGKVEKQYNSKQVSEIFLEAMSVLNVNFIARKLIYLGVLLFGPKF